MKICRNPLYKKSQTIEEFPDAELTPLSREQREPEYLDEEGLPVFSNPLDEFGLSDLVTPLDYYLTDTVPHAKFITYRDTEDSFC
jgi:hypothetical protein